MLSTKSVLEFSKNNRSFQFSCPPDSPIADVQEALHAFHAYTQRAIEEAKSKSEEVKPDPVSPDTEQTL